MCNTKKHGNKKSGESRTPINIIMYIFAKFKLAVFHAIFGFSRSIQWYVQGTIMFIDCVFCASKYNV